MAKFEELHTLVSAYAPNVPDFVAGNAIREAARQFFRKTHSYIVCTPVGLSEGENIGVVEPYEADIEILATLSIELDGEPITVKTALPHYVNQSGKPRYYIGDTKDQVMFYPTADKPYDMVARIAVRPSFTATELDDELVSENEEALRYGALMILKSQVATEWFSPEEISYYKNLFDQQINQKRIDALKRFTNVTPTVPIRSFH